MMDMGHPLHLIDLLAKLYRKQLAKVKVAGTLQGIVNTLITL